MKSSQVPGSTGRRETEGLPSSLCAGCTEAPCRCPVWSCLGSAEGQARGNNGGWGSALPSKAPRKPSKAHRRLQSYRRGRGLVVRALWGEGRGQGEDDS